MKKILTIVIPIIILVIFFFLLTKPTPVQPEGPNPRMQREIHEAMARRVQRLVLPQSELQISSGKSEIISFGILNLKGSPLNYEIRLKNLNVDDNGNKEVCGDEYFISDQENPCVVFRFDDELSSLRSNDLKIGSIKVTPKEKLDVYLVKLIIWNIDEGTEYASKTFFIQVAS